MGFTARQAAAALALCLLLGMIHAGGVTFTATSNSEARVPQKLNGQPQLLQAIVESNKAFREAFKQGGGPRPPLARDDDWDDDYYEFLRKAYQQRDGPTPGSAGARPTIIRTSGDADTLARPARWGLLSAVVDAYNHHHELVLRPDDIWQAILTQFSFYVNAHAEELRDRIVDFDGKKTLVVTMGGSLFTADYAEFAQRMVHENIVKNIKDPSVVEWVLPEFSTSTWTDKVVASVTLMSTLQTYFMYVGGTLCGIPKVTLLGTPGDWQQLRAKVDRLPEFDLGEGRMAAWHRLLAPVLDEFVKSSEGHPDLGFWDRVCSEHSAGSGSSYLSGWVTVFAVFTHKGKWQGTPGPPPPPDDVFVFAFMGKTWSESEFPWPFIDFDNLPGGVVSVPVLVDDNGIQYDTQLLAGQFAYQDYGEEGVALQPRTDWCMAYTGEPRAEPREYRHGEICSA